MRTTSGQRARAAAINDSDEAAAKTKAKTKANTMGDGDVRCAMRMSEFRGTRDFRCEVYLCAETGGKETAFLELGAQIHMERPLVLRRDSESVGTGLYGICEGVWAPTRHYRISRLRAPRGTGFASAPWGKLLRMCEGKCELNE